MSEINSTSQTDVLHTTPSVAYQKWRLVKDTLTAHSVVIGGLGVIAAVLLIFFYLLYVVFPMLLPASANVVTQYGVPDSSQGKTLFLTMEEQNEIGVRFTDSGKAVFFSTDSGSVMEAKNLPLPENTAITSFAHGVLNKGIIAYGMQNGQVLVAQQNYKLSYGEANKRTITPSLFYPLGEQAITMDQSGNAISLLALAVDDKQNTLVVKTADNRLLLSHFVKKESLFGDTASWERTDSVIDASGENVDYLLLDKEQRNLYMVSRLGALTVVDVSDKAKPQVKHKVNVVGSGVQVTVVEFLNADISLLIGDSTGWVSQWSIVRDQQNNTQVQRLRTFSVSKKPIAKISPEQRRKGFMAADSDGLFGVYNTTAERELIKANVNGRPDALIISPRANAFLLQTQDQKIHYWQVHNEHPEISITSLWREIWYESYSKPDFTWQSTSASNDFEPKLSLTPLVFGTLKGAFYAMLMAVPLSLLGAMYTGYFMTPAMRQYVKPGIEIMGALPSVILGFLAGLWLAPFVEENLTGIFAMLLVVPISVMIAAYCWQLVPQRIRLQVPEGWEGALLVPVIMLASWLALLVSPEIEALLFQGDLRNWLKNEFGIGYDQRNSLIVGLAMGFAVIPTIFSIAEDAIFSVPKHLTVGSLALGATYWQTMTRVILLTASPGIFSAVMIGFGRAVGETMIVLMATGNTAVMDFSIFQGMRTLSANIAVEMPESEVDSSHYRVLFLAALVLFMFTFVFNTLAEMIRHNLRQRYSSL